MRQKLTMDMFSLYWQKNMTDKIYFVMFDFVNLEKIPHILEEKKLKQIDFTLLCRYFRFNFFAIPKNSRDE